MKNQFKIIPIIMLSLGLSLLMNFNANAQVGIGTNTPNANSILELESSTKGVLFPRVALTGTANVTPLAAHVQGMTVYNTATTGDVTPGMYTNSGTAWVKLGASTPAFQDISGGLQTFTASGTISAGIYIVNMNNAGSTTLTLPTATQVGQTIWIKNQGLGAVTVNSSFTINATRSRAFVWDGSVWNCMIP